MHMKSMKTKHTTITKPTRTTLWVPNSKLSQRPTTIITVQTR